MRIEPATVRVERDGSYGRGWTGITSEPADERAHRHASTRVRVLASHRSVLSDHHGDPAMRWTPEYAQWRHGGWYVTNVRYPSGAVGCVSRNYPDGKWRIVCDPRSRDYTYPFRDAAASAERELVASFHAHSLSPMYTILGKPAGLYVCSDDAQHVADRNFRRAFVGDLIVSDTSLDGSETVTGSVEPGVPVNRTTLSSVLTLVAGHRVVATVNGDEHGLGETEMRLLAMLRASDADAIARRHAEVGGDAPTGEGTHPFDVSPGEDASSPAAWCRHCNCTREDHSGGH